MQQPLEKTVPVVGRVCSPVARRRASPPAIWGSAQPGGDDALQIARDNLCVFSASLAGVRKLHVDGTPSRQRGKFIERGCSALRIVLVAEAQEGQGRGYEPRTQVLGVVEKGHDELGNEIQQAGLGVYAMGAMYQEVGEGINVTVAGIQRMGERGERQRVHPLACTRARKVLDGGQVQGIGRALAGTARARVQRVEEVVEQDAEAQLQRQVAVSQGRQGMQRGDVGAGGIVHGQEDAMRA